MGLNDTFSPYFTNFDKNILQKNFDFLLFVSLLSGSTLHFYYEIVKT
jgi:hypothetical protein